MKYALILDGQVSGFRQFDTAPTLEDIKHAADGLPVLRPVETAGGDEHDAELYDRLGPDYDIQADRVVETYTFAPRPGWRDVLLARVDAGAEAARLTVITPGAGQAMVYQTKESEAQALLTALAAAGVEPAEVDEAAYPHLSAEVGVTAPTIEEVAHIVVAQADAWRQFSARIESTRLRAKRSVQLASDIVIAQAAVAVDWVAVMYPTSEPLDPPPAVVEEEPVPEPDPEPVDPPPAAEEEPVAEPAPEEEPAAETEPEVPA